MNSSILQYKLHNYFFCFCTGLLLCTHGNSQQTGNTRQVTVAIAPGYDSVGASHRFWFGEGYRKLWSAPVPLKVYDFNRQSGGITIQRTGGGLQTKSLVYKDAAGREWVLRSVQKYPERGLSPKLTKTVLKNILHDQVITSHPFGALTVPPFAKALGIPHSNPQLVFMPDDPDLGIYRDEFKNTVLLMEERTPDDSIRTDNTEKVQRKLQEDNDNRVHQKLVLRARLLDMLLGDWDRHEDQWRWERRQNGNETVYVPIPRDRDNVYYHTSGVLPWIVTHQWLMSRLQGFHNSIRDVNGYHFNSRFFDRFFLNELGEEDWKREIHFVQKTITDSLIGQAISLMPDTIVSLSGKRITETLKARRENLAQDALTYYRFLSASVDIATSDKHELFSINFEEGAVRLTIIKIKKDHTREQVLYQRMFDPAVTKEIRLYGLDGNDVFVAEGTHSSPIKIRMIGGDGVDSFSIHPENKNKRRLALYDRSDQENIVYANGAKMRFTTDSSVNEYNRRSFRYDRSGPVLSLFVNMDYGTLTTIGWIREKQGFRKSPYASRQLVAANYSIARRSFTLRYNGEWRSVFGKSDLLVNAVSRGPYNISNFFGTGNETVFINPGRRGLVYYRNRYDLVDADIRIKRSIGNSLSLSGGIAGQYYTSAAKNNRLKFLGDYHVQKPLENVFDSKFFVGLVAGFKHAPLSGLLPVKAFSFLTDVKAMKQVGGQRKSFGTVTSEATFSLPLAKDSGLVLMNRTGGGTTVGDPLFYQMMQLGGIDNLRGYNSERFTGRSMFYNNTELAVKLFDFESYFFPGSFGVIGFSDVGRVWMPGERSTTWHHGYGGGIYLTPANVIVLKVIVGHSKEITQLYANLSIGL